MGFNLSSLLIGIIAMDVIACIEVIIFANIIKKKMGLRVRPLKIKTVAAKAVNDNRQNAYPQHEVTKTVYRDAKGRFCKKEDAAIVGTVNIVK